MLVINFNLTGILRNSVFSLILLTPILFICAEVLYRYFDNLFTRIIYLISSYIGGIFLNWFHGQLALSAPLSGAGIGTASVRGLWP